MNMKEYNKTLLFSVLAGSIFWTADAAIDSFVFSQRSFLSSLLFGLSAHELYLRCLMLLGFILFGIVIPGVMAKHKAAEERYENIVELSNDIIYITDKEGRLTFMNNAAYRLLERSPEEVIGTSFADMLHPEDREKSFTTGKELSILHTDTLNIENRYITASGKTINVMHNVRVLRNEQGEFAGTQGIARDITKRKHAEEELQKAIEKIENEKARSESIIAAIGDGISIQNTDFKVLYQNQVHKEIIGGDKAGQLCYEVYGHGASICPGCPVALSFQDGGIHSLEKTMVLNGSTHTLEVKASPLMDSSGRIIAGIEVVRDITERKKAGEQLKMFSEAIEEAMDGIQITDLEGKIVYSNKAVREIYGFTPEELRGRHVNEMNADKEFAAQVIIPKIRECGRWIGELMVVHKDWRTFPIWLSTSLVKNEQGDPIAMIGIIRDITERKQAEAILKRHHEDLKKLVDERTEELTRANEMLRREIVDRERMEQELLKAQKLESLGILAGGIAHDFNNLLTSIMGKISLAMLDLKPEERPYQQLEGAEKASRRAQDLTRQLLTFSKGGTPVKKITSISESIREAAGLALWGARVKCEFFIPPDLWYADVDEGQISQVVHNLVINADHAMPTGGTITIRCENKTISGSSESPLKPGDYVMISVQDHGVGISNEHLSKIFDPYFTTKQKGSGLGLATSYSIIRKHGGHILAKSQLGKGTVFVIFLPAAKVLKAPKMTDEARLLSGTGRVLIMDDEEDVRQTTGDVLKRLGYSVEFAADGAQAIELYQKARETGTPFDAVIMDLTVPGGMGGREALEKLLVIDPEVTAIVSSGYSNDPVLADYNRYGFSGAITKPFRISDLGEMLHAVVRTKAPGSS